MVVKTRRKYNGGRYTRKLRGGAGRSPTRGWEAPPLNFDKRASAPGRLARAASWQPTTGNTPHHRDEHTQRLSGEQKGKLQNLYENLRVSQDKLDDIIGTEKVGDQINEAVEKVIDMCSLISLFELLSELGPIAVQYVSTLPAIGSIHTAIKMIMSYMRVKSPPMIFVKSVVDLLSILPTYALVGVGTAVTILVLAKRKKLLQSINGNFIKMSDDAEKVQKNLAAAARRFSAANLKLAETTVDAVVTAMNPEAAADKVLTSTLTILEDIVNNIPGNIATKTYVKEVIEVLTSDEKLAKALETSVHLTKHHFVKELVHNAETGMTPAQEEYFSGLRPPCSFARRDTGRFDEAARRSQKTPAHQAGTVMMEARKRKADGGEGAINEPPKKRGGGGRKTRRRTRKRRKSRRRKSRRNSRKGGYKYKKKKSSRRRN